VNAQAAETRWVDLHLHTHFSDGVDSPEDLVRRAAAIGVSALAVTDHDTVSGVIPAQKTAVQHGMDFLPGVEISAAYDRHEIHIVGMGMDVAHPALLALLARQQTARAERAIQIADRLRDRGIEVDLANILGRVAQGALGRIHIAQEVVSRGYEQTVQSVFDRFIGRGKCAYAPKRLATAEETIHTLHAAGGLAFLGHPGLPATRKHIDVLLQLGFDGIEAYHCRHSPGQTDSYCQLARERGLLIGGGSDCHGVAKGQRPEMGKVRVPFGYFLAIRARLP